MRTEFIEYGTKKLLANANTIVPLIIGQPLYLKGETATAEYTVLSIATIVSNDNIKNIVILERV